MTHWEGRTGGKGEKTDHDARCTLGGGRSALPAGQSVSGGESRERLLLRAFGDG